MNRPLSPSELDQLTVVALPLKMTRHAKLLRFAEIIRAAPSSRKKSGFFSRYAGQSFVIFHHIEYMSDEQLNERSHPDSAFALAAADPVLREAGLASDTVGAAKRFFELSKDDLHAFSCDCGGVITNERMADRIEQIADRAA
jgi:hypothetical protein